MEKQEALKGSTTKLNPCTFAKDGYYFSYWEDDFGKTYKDQDYIVVNTDIRLSAKWEKSGTSTDPTVVISNNDDEIIKSIKEYQQLRQLDDTIKPNTWYTVGTNLWYLIGSDLKPVKGWYEEKKDSDESGIITDRTSSTIITISTPSEPALEITDDKKKYIVLQSKETTETTETIAGIDGAKTSELRTTDTKANETATSKLKISMSPSTKETVVRPGKVNVINKIEEESKINDDTSRWYYLDPDTALLTTGWKVIDKKYYYFATVPIEADMVFDKVSGTFISNGYDKLLGQMYADEYTPEGRYVNKNGEMVNQYK